MDQELPQKPLSTKNLSSLQSLGWILVLIIVPNILGYIITNILFDITVPDLENSNIRVLLISNITSAFFTVFIIHHLIKIDPQIICKNYVSNKKLASIFFFWLTITITYKIFSHELGIEKSEFLYGIEDSIFDLALGIVAICIIAPIIEEVIYRGVFFSFLLQNNFSKTFILIISSLAFTLIHFQYGLAELTFIFIFSIFLGIVRLKTNNIFLCISIHSINNIYALSNYLITH